MWWTHLAVELSSIISAMASTAAGTAISVEKKYVFHIKDTFLGY